MDENKEYSLLYDICVGNYTGKKDPLLVSKDAFLSDLRTNIDCVDLGKLNTLDKKSFIQASYRMLVNRYPDESALQQLRGLDDSDIKLFRKNVISGLMSSLEYQAKNNYIENNIFIEQDEDNGFHSKSTVIFLKRLYAKQRVLRFSENAKKRIKSFLRW